MDWYKTIKRFYDQNLWTIEQVGAGVYAGKITAEQYKQITGEDYIEPEVAPFSNQTSL